MKESLHPTGKNMFENCNEGSMKTLGLKIESNGLKEHANCIQVRREWFIYFVPVEKNVIIHKRPVHGVLNEAGKF